MVDVPPPPPLHTMHPEDRQFSEVVPDFRGDGHPTTVNDVYHNHHSNGFVNDFDRTRHGSFLDRSIGSTYDTAKTRYESFLLLKGSLDRKGDVRTWDYPATKRYPVDKKLIPERFRTNYRLHRDDVQSEFDKLTDIGHYRAVEYVMEKETRDDENPYAEWILVYARPPAKKEPWFGDVLPSKAIHIILKRQDKEAEYQPPLRPRGHVRSKTEADIFAIGAGRRESMLQGDWAGDPARPNRRLSRRDTDRPDTRHREQSAYHRAQSQEHNATPRHASAHIDPYQDNQRPSNDAYGLFPNNESFHVNPPPMDNFPQPPGAFPDQQQEQAQKEKGKGKKKPKNAAAQGHGTDLPAGNLFPAATVFFDPIDPFRNGPQISHDVSGSIPNASQQKPQGNNLHHSAPAQMPQGQPQQQHAPYVVPPAPDAPAHDHFMQGLHPPGAWINPDVNGNPHNVPNQPWPPFQPQITTTQPSVSARKYSHPFEPDPHVNFPQAFQQDPMIDHAVPQGNYHSDDNHREHSRERSRDHKHRRSSNDKKDFKRLEDIVEGLREEVHDRFDRLHISPGTSDASVVDDNSLFDVHSPHNHGFQTPQSTPPQSPGAQRGSIYGRVRKGSDVRPRYSRGYTGGFDDDEVVDMIPAYTYRDVRDRQRWAPADDYRRSGYPVAPRPPNIRRATITGVGFEQDLFDEARDRDYGWDKRDAVMYKLGQRRERERGRERAEMGAHYYYR